MADKKIDYGIQKVFISPNQIPSGYRDLGLVTGYCALGTGPFSNFMSAITDTLGKKSGVYLKKIKEAENNAIAMIKKECLELGGNAIYNVHISLTEATCGNGMLMITVSGAAVTNN